MLVTVLCLSHLAFCVVDPALIYCFVMSPALFSAGCFPKFCRKTRPGPAETRAKAHVPEMWKGGLNRQHDFMAKFTLHKVGGSCGSMGQCMQVDSCLCAFVCV